MSVESLERRAGAVWAAALGLLVETLGFRVTLYAMAASYLAAACWIVPLRGRERGQLSSDQTSPGRRSALG